MAENGSNGRAAARTEHASTRGAWLARLCGLGADAEADRFQRASVRLGERSARGRAGDAPAAPISAVPQAPSEPGPSALERLLKRRGDVRVENRDNQAIHETGASR